MHTPELFHSAHAALTFAFNYATAQYPQSALAQLMTGNIGSGKGLVGLDGAGQAGMVLREVDGLSSPVINGKPNDHYAGPAAKYLITARFAPGKPKSCSCFDCPVHAASRAWIEATEKLAELSLQHMTDKREGSAGSVRNPGYYLRVGIVRRFFGETMNMSDLAKYGRVKRDTAAENNAIMVGWLKKEQDRAWSAAERALRESGMVG